VATVESAAGESSARPSQAAPLRALARRGFADARIRTLAFAYLFAVYAFIQPVGYRHAYPEAADRAAFARSFAQNVGLRLFYGEPHRVDTVDGYTAWRVGGTLAIAAAIFGLLAAVRALRADEDAGRTELVLSGIVARRTLSTAAAGAIGAGILTLWVAEVAGFVVGGVPVGGAAYLALATASAAVVCAGVGAVASQLAPNRRLALEIGGALVGLFFLLRVVADTTSGVGWLRWATPLGWAEELRPFAGPQPLVLLLPLGASVLLLAASARIAARRDVGAGLLPERDTADPSLRLLSSPEGQALRSGLGTLIAWTGCVAIFAFILGTISTSISTADVSGSVQKQIAKLGVGSITTPTGYLAFVFIFVTLAVVVFACTQFGAAKDEETDHRLETLLALPVGRKRWLGGRLVLAAAAAAAIALSAGLLTWAGAASGGASVSLPRMLEAGANVLPVTLLFLGIAALAYAVAPRASSGIAYGLVAVAFVWQLVGSLVSASGWLLGLTPFAHVALVPAEPFDTRGAVVMAAIGVAAAIAALLFFERRDLVGD
jgi:polyether ionophore transport system permease protein